MKELVFEVVEIKGRCPVYEKGDRIVIDWPEIVLEQTDALCIQTFQKSSIKNFVWIPESRIPKEELYYSDVNTNDEENSEHSRSTA